MIQSAGCKRGHWVVLGLLGLGSMLSLGLVMLGLGLWLLLAYRTDTFRAGT